MSLRERSNNGLSGTCARLALEYTLEDVVCVDMKEFYHASFQGKGVAAPWFRKFGHPSHRVIKVSINGPLPKDIGSSFAEVQDWEFKENIHPVIPT